MGRNVKKHNMMDFGSINSISRFYDCKINFERDPNWHTKHDYRNAYLTAKRCIKGEFKRKTIDSEEYNSIINDIEKAYIIKK